MKIILSLLLVVFFASCEPPQTSDERALIEYTCTVEQMEKAQKEADWCNKNTDYFSGYCYRSAIIRNCSKR